MAETVTITIDHQDYHVPQGANLVDAAKEHGIDIPVFCHHPKLKSVGMCRMCLVELGSVVLNRETGEPELDDAGQPVVRWFPTLQTACTQAVRDGMVVLTTTAQVAEGRSAILEFLLTSHPLDCPVCDKGGECPLQNLTMAYGPGDTRFNYDDKQLLEKQVPLGDLIYLDRERCIQCARCTRFCAEIVGDDVLAFHERGRRSQIVTISDPPFDTKFSGNTTDICPVGALTTVDFRFGARAWEIDEVPSICPYCPVGCNISASTRLDRDFGGKKMIKRIMPRQNEQVNEIWICDKGRFGHHHSRAAERLQQPMQRQNGAWVEIDWQTAYQEIAAKLTHYGERAGFLVGPGLSNEDIWEMRRLARFVNSEQLGTWPATMSGNKNVAQVGVGVGTRLPGMGPESAILVIASDLEEEAPVWWLQVKQAVDRGATVVVANGRETKLDRYAQTVVRYDYGTDVALLNNFAVIAHRVDAIDEVLIAARVDGYDDFKAALKGARVPKLQAQAAEVLLAAENLVIFVGGEGLTLERHTELMQAAANLLIVTGHVGRPNNGLVPVWPGANMQGVLDMGFSPETTAAMLENPPAMWFISAADPLSEDVAAAQGIADAEFVVVSTQFMTPTAEQADIVLPIQSFAEREGTYTNGMRRVQRFYMAQTPAAETLPAWKVFASIRAGMKGGGKPRISANMVMHDIARHVLRYVEISYAKLTQVESQQPSIGGDDLYYGGTAYSNRGGLGVSWATSAEQDTRRLAVRPVDKKKPKAGKLAVVPVRVLYDRETLFVSSAVMHPRVPAPYAEINTQDADKLGITDGDLIQVSAGVLQVALVARVNGKAPMGTVLLPQQLSPASVPVALTTCVVQKIEEEE